MTSTSSVRGRAEGRIIFVALIGWVALAQAQTTQPIEREINFSGAGDVKLIGSLMLPAGASASAKVPAMLLVPGSGPTDRDGNQLPLLKTDLLKQIATALAKNGVASFRFDKRVVGAAAKSIPADRDGMAEYVRWEHFVTDTALSLRAMQQQPEIDLSRCGLLGHSEGGSLVLCAIDQLKDANAPRAIALIATPGRPADQIIVEQVNGLLVRQGAPPQQAKYFIDQTNRIIEAIRTSATVPPDVPAGLRALFPEYIGKFLQSEFALNPGSLARGFPGPVLVVNGANDIQISAERDAINLDAALKARPNDDHQLLLLDGLSHNLKPVQGPADPGFAGEVPAEAMNQIVTWIVGSLRATNAP